MLRSVASQWRDCRCGRSLLVALDVQPWCLVCLDVVMLALPLGDVDVAFLVLVQEGLGFADENVLSRRIVLSLSNFI